MTGGAGFLGSHLIDRLVGQGHEVLCVDNLFTGTKDNIAHLHANPNFEFLRHDVTFPLFVEVDEIYNLACPASPIHYQHDPVQTTKTSVHGAINMLGLAKRLGCKILQASTSEVYGDPSGHPQTESYWGNVNPIGPRSCHDEGKRCAETLFFDYHRQHGCRSRSRAFSTPTAQNAPAGRPSSIKLHRPDTGNEPITTYDDGRQTRSFSYVDDLISGLIVLRETVADVTWLTKLGNPREFTMLELAEQVKGLTGSTSSIRFRPLPQDDQRQPDISLARTHLGWAPTVSLEQGLAPTIDYFRGLIAS